MKVSMWLCDHAAAVDGKLYMLGAGWAVAGPVMPPIAIAIKIEIDQLYSGSVQNWKLQLFDEDGRQVVIPTPEGNVPIEISGILSSEKVSDVPAELPLDHTLAINMSPLPSLMPGKRYEFRFFVESRSDEDWSVGFYVRPADE